MRQSDHRFVCEAPRYHPDDLFDPFFDDLPPAYRDALPLSQRTPSGKSTFVTSLSERDPDSFRKGARL